MNGSRSWLDHPEEAATRKGKEVLMRLDETHHPGSKMKLTMGQKDRFKAPSGLPLANRLPGARVNSPGF